MKKIFKRISAAVIALAVMLTAVVFDVPGKLTAEAVGVLDFDSYHLDDDGKLTIKDNNGMQNWINRGASDYANVVKTIEIQSQVTFIPEQVFKDYELLESIELSSNLKSINLSSFAYCTKLKSITIPASVTRVDSTAFTGCAALTEINVEAGNSEYSSENGVLFNKSKTKLTCYPGGKQGNYEIPSSVETIEGGAFSECQGLTSMTIPSTVTYIGGSAFNQCRNLSEIIYPSKAELGGGNNHFPADTIKVKYTVNSGKLNVTEITLGTYKKENFTVKDDMNISFVAEAERSKVSQEGHTHIYKDTNGNATDACVICNYVHKHGICGVSGCTDKNHPAGHNTEINWTAINDASGFDSLANGGHYYLTAPVALTKEVTITNNITLCLNGQTLTAANGKRIFTVNGGSLTLCDCNGNGKLTGGSMILSILLDTI